MWQIFIFFRIQCPDCDKTFNNSGGLKQHQFKYVIILHHLMFQCSINLIAMKFCQECDCAKKTSVDG